MQQPMPLLAKKKFTPLRDEAVVARVSNSSARESSPRTSSRIVLEPPPSVVQNVPQTAGPPLPVFTAAPRQYVHPPGKIFESISIIPNRAHTQVGNICPPRDIAKTPTEQDWKLTIQEYSPYGTEPSYDYVSRKETYRDYSVPEGSLGKSPYRGNRHYEGPKGLIAVQSQRKEGGELGPARRYASQIPEFDLRKSQPSREARLDSKKLDPFDSSNSWKSNSSLSQCCRTFMAKPTIYENDLNRMGFTVLYLVGTIATHYDNLLKQKEDVLSVSALHNWVNFATEVTSYFGLLDPIRDTQVELVGIKQMDNESFATLILQFQEYAYKMGYNNMALVTVLKGAVTMSLNVTIAAQWNPPHTYHQGVPQIQEVDNLIRVTIADRSRGGNPNFGTYNAMGPVNPQPSNQCQGFNLSTNC